MSEAPVTPDIVTPVAEPTVVPTPMVSDWTTMRTSLPAELRDNPALDAYSSGDNPSGLKGLVESHLELSKLVGGEKVTKPGKDATIADWGRYYKELGRPESAEQYDLGDYKAPSDVPWDPELQKALLGDLFDAGLSTAQANHVLRSYTARTTEQYQSIGQHMNEFREQADSTLKADWGTAYAANHELAERVFATAFPGEQLERIAAMELVDGTMIGDNPYFIRGMYEIGRRMAEGTLVDGLGSARLSLTPESATAEIAAMEGDPIKAAILTNLNHPEHKQLADRHRALYAAANPEV